MVPVDFFIPVVDFKWNQADEKWWMFSGAGW
jgi:hypothetical protein